MPLYLTDEQAMLRDTARSFMAEAKPTVRLVNEDAREAHLAELLPKRMAEAVLAVHVAIFAQLAGNRPLARHEIARAVAQHRLVFGEVERHQAPGS